VVLDGVNGGEPQVCYLDMAAKLDQTAESICGPKWAIARDLSIYERDESEVIQASSKGSKVSADRGPPMVRTFFFVSVYMLNVCAFVRFGLLLSVAT